MSLKAFHIVFIAASIVFALGWGGWLLQQYWTERHTDQLLLGLGAIAAGILLSFYGKAMLRKLRHIDLS